MFIYPIAESGRGEHKNHDPEKHRSAQGTMQAKGLSHVRANPSEDDVGTAVAVVVGLLSSSVTVLPLLWGLDRQSVARCIPELVDVLAGRGDFDLENFLAIRVLDLLRPTEIFGSAVVTLGTPGDIVKVAHRVHH